MKPLVIIAIAVVIVGIVGFFFYQQQSQIDMLENQLQLDRELEACQRNSSLNLEKFQNCALGSFRIYGTPEQYENYRDSIWQAKEDVIIQEEVDEKMYKSRIEHCRTEYIGQTDKLLWCLDRAEQYKQTGDYYP
jgi:hypothetical protein